MGFMNSALMWGGLGVLGVSVPVIIHLLKRYRVIQWGAMALLLKTLKRRRRKIRMEDLIVLLLRCLALLFLALALMRPTILSRGGAWLMGASRVGMVIAIDASYSMAHGEVGNRFEQARRQAKAILSTVNPGDPVTIVLMGSRPRVLARLVGYEERRVENILDEATPLPEHLNLEFCLERVRQLMTEMKTPLRECYIISDAQAATWQTLTDKAIAELRAMAKAPDTKAKVYFVQVSSGHEENLAITRLEFAGGTVRRGASAQFVAEVVNKGLATRDTIPVSGGPQGLARPRLLGMSRSRGKVGTLRQARGAHSPHGSFSKCSRAHSPRRSRQ